MSSKNKRFKPVEENPSVHTGTEAWNIAQYFTGYSIALPLNLLNELEDIARFGSLKIDEDLSMTDDIIDKRRADAVKRYWQKLKQVVGDTLFKVKSSDRKDAGEIMEWLQEIPKYFDGLLTIKTDDVNHDDKLEVNEEFLNRLINKLFEKKLEYLYILDRAGLIFRESDEIDLDKLSNEFIHGG